MSRLRRQLTSTELIWVCSEFSFSRRRIKEVPRGLDCPLSVGISQSSIGSGTVRLIEPFANSNSSPQARYREPPISEFLRQLARIMSTRNVIKSKAQAA